MPFTDQVNKQYRVFIADIESSAPEYEARAPLKRFKKEFNHKAKGIGWGSVLAEYLASKQNFADLFLSEQADDVGFNGDDQPVVGVSWYAARDDNYGSLTRTARESYEPEFIFKTIGFRIVRSTSL